MENQPNNRVEFTKLLAVAFVSQSGSYLLTIAISAFIFLKTGSPIQAAIVFVLSYLPSVFGSAKLGHLIDRHLSKGIIIFNELLGILLSVLCALSIYYSYSIYVVCLLISIRSLLNIFTRTSLTKWIKDISSPQQQTERIQLFFLSYFLSTATAGVLAGFTLMNGNILTVLLVDVVTYLIAICVLLLLKPRQVETNPLPGLVEQRISYTNTLKDIFSASITRMAFVLVCASASLFQGAYSVLNIYLPLQHFGESADAVSWFQIAASVGITIGFLINWKRSSWLSEENVKRPYKASVLYSLGIVSLLSCVLSSDIPTSLVFFFLMNLFYELIWLYYCAQFFRASPKESTGRFQFVFNASSSCTMAIATLLYSIFLEQGALIGSTVRLIGLVLVGVALFSLFTSLMSRNFKLNVNGKF